MEPGDADDAGLSIRCCLDLVPRCLPKATVNLQAKMMLQKGQLKSSTGVGSPIPRDRSQDQALQALHPSDKKMLREWMLEMPGDLDPTVGGRNPLRIIQKQRETHCWLVFSEKTNKKKQKHHSSVS